MQHVVIITTAYGKSFTVDGFSGWMRDAISEAGLPLDCKRTAYGNTTVTVPVHPEFAESLRAARAVNIIGAEVFTGKLVRGRVLPMNKKAWASKLKKYAVLAGVNEPKKSCHGVRKARAEVAASADCTESQMMAMFGWTDPKMPAHYIAQANRERLGISGMEKIVTFWVDVSHHRRSWPVSKSNPVLSRYAGRRSPLEMLFNHRRAMAPRLIAWTDPAVGRNEACQELWSQSKTGRDVGQPLR